MAICLFRTAMTNDMHPLPLLDLLRAVAETDYAFVPPTPETHRRVNGRNGDGPALGLRDIFGWSRPFAPEVAGAHIFTLLRAAGALERDGSLWKCRVRVATLNGRHYLHSAYPTTGADSVFFGPDTYRFVRAALEWLPARRYERLIDLGCGSGAGGLEVAAERDVGELWLADINPAALAMAQANAAHAGQPASFAESDLFAAIDGDFDLVLANPPYLVDPAKRAYRDGGGELGMELGIRIVREGLDRLAAGGVLFVYTGAPIVAGVDQFRLAMEQTAPRHGFIVRYGEIDPDVFGEELDAPAYSAVDRIAAVALMITRLRT
jgi:methylase of polypeptide subunit release factors